MRYVTIVPKYAIDRLLTTALDVHFLWMQTKHDANLDFLFLMQMPFIKMQMQNIHMMHIFSFQRCNSWCKCLMQGWRYEVYSWWRQRTYLLVMQMSPYRDEDAKCLVVRVLSNGYVMMQMLMQVCHDVNAPLWVCHDVNVHVCMSWCKCPLVGMSWCKCSCIDRKSVV